jgi:hypothetical protein
MALSKIQSESVNLADNFAFTGTVTGAGSEGLVHLETQTGTNVTGVKFGNDVVNINNYKKYCVIGRALPVGDNVALRLRFMDASENDIVTTEAYKYAHNGGTNVQTTYIQLSASIGSTNTLESGVLFNTNIDIEHLGTADFQAIVSSRLTRNNSGNNWTYSLVDAGYGYGYDSTQPAGFHFYTQGDAGFERVRISLFGVTEGS